MIAGCSALSACCARQPGLGIAVDREPLIAAARCRRRCGTPAAARHTAPCIRQMASRRSRSSSSRMVKVRPTISVRRLGPLLQHVTAAATGPAGSGPLRARRGGPVPPAPSCAQPLARPRAHVRPAAGLPGRYSPMAIAVTRPIGDLVDPGGGIELVCSKPGYRCRVLWRRTRPPLCRPQYRWPNVKC